MLHILSFPCRRFMSLSSALQIYDWWHGEVFLGYLICLIQSVNNQLSYQHVVGRQDWDDSSVPYLVYDGQHVIAKQVISGNDCHHIALKAVSNMTADALVMQGAAIMTSTVQDKCVLVFDKEGYQLLAPSQCWEVIQKGNLTFLGWVHLMLV